MEDKGVLVTQEGYEKLEKELDYLKTEKRAEIAEKIKVALGFGDLSENSEYDEAKNAQAENEGKIAELENKITSIESSNDSSRMKSKLEQLQGIIDTTSISIDNIDKKIIEEQKTVYIHIYYVMQVRHGKKEKSTSLPYDTH